LFISAPWVSKQFGLHWLTMLGAAVKVRADLVRMLRAEMPITCLSRLRYMVALEAAWRAAAGNRAAMHALPPAGADDAGDAAGQTKGRAGHDRYLASGA
ncbi:MAG: hypothetical protein RXS25_41830, partial [Paraburkholderia sp.]|uniref:hypothetical protein n=1 Tax=Paraburkholderia sp. TaxID=1926495 RepID=UPI00397D18BB